MVRNNNKLVVEYDPLSMAEALETIEQGKPVKPDVWRNPLTTAQIKEHIVKLDKAQNHNLIPRLIDNAKLYRMEVESTGADDPTTLKAFASYQTHVLQKLIKLSSHNLPSIHQFLYIMHAIERDMEAQKMAKNYPAPDMSIWACLNALAAAKLIKIRGGAQDMPSDTADSDGVIPLEGWLYHAVDVDEGSDDDPVQDYTPTTEWNQPEEQFTEFTAGHDDFGQDDTSAPEENQPAHSGTDEEQLIDSTSGEHGGWGAGYPSGYLAVPTPGDSQPNESTSGENGGWGSSIASATSPEQPTSGENGGWGSSIASATSPEQPTSGENGGWGSGNASVSWGAPNVEGAASWQGGSDTFAQAPAEPENLPPEETGVVPVVDVPTHELSIEQMEKSFRLSYTNASPDSPLSNRSRHEWLGENVLEDGEIIPHPVDLGGSRQMDHRPLRPHEHSLVRESTVLVTGAEDIRHPEHMDFLVAHGETKSDWTLDPVWPPPSISHELFILHKQSAAQYGEMVLELFREARNVSEQRVLDLSTAFHWGLLCEPDSYGAQWFRSLGSARRDRVLMKLRELPRHLEDFETWREKTKPSSSYDDGDMIVLAGSSPEPVTTEWAAKQWTSSEPQREGKHFSTTRNHFYNTLQPLVDVTADDIPFTPQETDRWYKVDRKAFDNADALDKDYGVTERQTDMSARYRPKIKTEKPVAELDAAELDDIEEDDGIQEEQNSSNQSVMLGESFEYGCIILTDQGQPEFLTTYAEEDLATVGNSSEGRLATNVCFVAKPYQKPTVCIRHSCIVQNQKITFLEAVIPMHKLVEEPWYDQLPGEVVSKTWEELGSPLPETADVEGAWRVNLCVDSDSIVFRDHTPGRKQLVGAGAPGMDTEISRIMHGYQATRRLRLTAYISQKWADFEAWATRLARLHQISQTDELADLTKKVDTGCIIEPHTVNMNLPSITTQVDAKQKFESAEEYETWLSDIVSREQRHAELTLDEATKMPLKVALIPMGVETVDVKDIKGGDHKVPFLWQLLVTKAKDMNRLLEILPPVGTDISFEISIAIAKYMVPEQLKPEAELIADEIISQVSKIPPGDEKKELIEIMAIISQYVKEKEKPTKEDDQSRIEFLAYLANMFRKVRATAPEPDKAAEAGESNQRHRERVIKSVTGFHKKGAFIMPPRSSNAPTVWRGVRTQLEGPLTGITQLSAIVRLPHVPDWPKGVPNRPFILPKVPELPNRDCSVENFAYKLRNVLENISLDASLNYTIDEKTIKCRIKGLKGYDQVKHKRVYKWLRDFQGPPVTVNVFKLYPLLDSVLNVYLAKVNPMGYPEDSEGQAEIPFAPLEFDEDGDPLVWTTEEYQRRQRDLVVYFADQLLKLDEGQRQFFFSFSRLPFGYAFLQGCAGAGKSTVMNLVASIMQASPVNRRQLHKFTHEVELPPTQDKPEFKFASDIRTETVVEFPEDEEVVMPEPPVATDFQPSFEPSGEDKDDTPAGTEETAPLAGKDTPLIVGLPALPFGPSIDQVINDPDLEILKAADEPQQWLDKLKGNIRDLYMANLREHALAYSQHIRAEFMSSTLALLNDRRRHQVYTELLQWNMIPWWSKRESLFEQWWHKVLLALVYIDDESNDDNMPSWEAVDLDSDEVLFDPELFAQGKEKPGSDKGEPGIKKVEGHGEPGETETEAVPTAEDVPDYAALVEEDNEASQDGPSQDTPEPAVMPPPVNEPSAMITEQDGVEFVEPEKPPPEEKKEAKHPEGHDLICGAKGLCCVVRNDAAEHIADSLKDDAAKAGLTPMGSGKKVIFKVNSLEATVGSLVNEYRTRRRPEHPFYEDDKLTSRERLYLGMHPGLYEDFAKREGQFDPDARLSGGVYRLDARVRGALKHDKYRELKALLEMEGDPNAPEDPKRSQKIRKDLKDIIRKLLRGADWVICTDVVAVDLADQHLYPADIILFDEAALHPETDTMMVNLHYPTAYIRIYGGDHHQGMIFLLSANLGVFNTTTTRLHQSKKFLREGDEFVLDERGDCVEVPWDPYNKDNEVFRRNPTYRTKDEENGGSQPGTRIFRMSELRRVSMSAPQYVTNLVINHRSKGNTHELASAIAYDGMMQSSWNPNIRDPVLEAIHEYLYKKTVSAELTRSDKDSPKELVPHTNCLTIYNDGAPTADGSSRTNMSHVRIALSEAAQIHQAGLCGYDGKLLRIAILTPYNSALQQVRTQMRRMPYEMCLDRVQTSTIDSFQGNECDFVIIPWVADAAAGFLHEPQKLLVASTRARLGRMDIVHPALVAKRGVKWWHWRKLASITEKNGAGLPSGDWTVLDPKTYLPQGVASVEDMVCYFCRVTGHHPRNCPQRQKWPRGGGLNEDPAQNYTPPEAIKAVKSMPKSTGQPAKAIRQGDGKKNALVQQLTQSLADFSFGEIDELKVTARFLGTEVEASQDWKFDKAQAEEDLNTRQQKAESEEDDDDLEDDDGGDISFKPKMSKRQAARARKRARKALGDKAVKTSDITSGANLLGFGDKKHKRDRKKDTANEPQEAENGQEGESNGQENGSWDQSGGQENTGDGGSWDQSGGQNTGGGGGWDTSGAQENAGDGNGWGGSGSKPGDW